MHLLSLFLLKSLLVLFVCLFSTSVGFLVRMFVEMFITFFALPIEAKLPSGVLFQRLLWAILFRTLVPIGRFPCRVLFLLLSVFCFLLLIFVLPVLSLLFIC